MLQHLTIRDTVARFDSSIQRLLRSQHRRRRRTFQWESRSRSLFPSPEACHPFKMASPVFACVYFFSPARSLFVYFAVLFRALWRPLAACLDQSRVEPRTERIVAAAVVGIFNHRVQCEEREVARKECECFLLSEKAVAFEDKRVCVVWERERESKSV